MTPQWLIMATFAMADESCIVCGFTLHEWTVNKTVLSSV